MYASYPRDPLAAVPAPARRRHLAGMLASILAASAVAVSLLPGSAAASSSGCTYTTFPIDFVCFGINGQSTHVSDFWVTRNRNGPANCIYNSHAEVWVKTAGGRQVYFHRTPVHRGCVAVRKPWRIWVNRHFPHDSTACGAAYEDGRLQAIACLKIFR